MKAVLLVWSDFQPPPARIERVSMHFFDTSPRKHRNQERGLLLLSDLWQVARDVLCHWSGDAVGITRLIPGRVVLFEFALQYLLDRFSTINFHAIKLIARPVRIINVMEIRSGSDPPPPHALNTDGYRGGSWWASINFNIVFYELSHIF